MGLTVALQMDPVDSIDFDADSSFALALAAARRGHRLFHYLPQDLTMTGNRPTARARPLTVRPVRGNHAVPGPAERIDLEAMDVVLLRQDPPFDMGYIATTHILEHIHPRTLVVNDPVAVRNAPEKLFAARFPALTPPTLVTADPVEIRAFRAEHGDIVVKPLYGNGGAGVFHLRADDTNLNALLEMFARFLGEPVVVQKYLPAVRQGDKRIILIEGEPAGAVNRVPPPGEARSNMHIGGKAEPARITAREREICTALGPELRRLGLIFVGIDVIDGWLTEVNVTSPTGLQETSRFDGVDLAGQVWDAIEARLAQTGRNAG